MEGREENNKGSIIGETDSQILKQIEKFLLN